MVVVFVSNEDAIEPGYIVFDGGKPRERFAFAKSGVNQESGMLGLE